MPLSGVKKVKKFHYQMVQKSIGSIVRIPETLKQNEAKSVMSLNEHQDKCFFSVSEFRSIIVTKAL